MPSCPSTGAEPPSSQVELGWLQPHLARSRVARPHQGWPQMQTRARQSVEMVLVSRGGPPESSAHLRRGHPGRRLLPAGPPPGPTHLTHHQHCPHLCPLQLLMWPEPHPGASRASRGPRALRDYWETRWKKRQFSKSSLNSG